MNEVWKVCRIEGDGTFWSAYADMPSSRALGLDLEYPLHERVVAPEGTVGILCFSTQAQAKSFVGNMMNFAVLRCATRHVPQPIGAVFHLWRTDLWLRGAELLRLPWRRFNGTFAAPGGSVTIPSLTPVECVWERGLV